MAFFTQYAAKGLAVQKLPESRRKTAEALMAYR